MRVRGNWIALSSWRSFSGAANGVEKSIAHLSSGLRINSASDDAAGLGIANRIKGQFRGLIQANRNALDGISLVQTAESALDEVHTLLQRGRELSLHAANDTLGKQEKSQIQYEIDHILAEIDRISDTATFNNRKLLSSGDNTAAASVLNGLRSGWLEESEKLINQYYGLVGDLSTITVVLHQDGASSAWITGSRNASTGRLDNLTLNINLRDFGAGGGPDGGAGPIYNDRKVARALTQAMLSRNSDVNLVDAWFVSGVSDYIAGGNEQLKANLATYGAQAIVDAMNDALSGTWQDDSLHRTAAYVAVRYLDSKLPPYQMSDVMQDLQLAGSTLSHALLNAGGDTVFNFITSHFSVDGVAFIQSLNLNTPDVGAIGGGDASQVIPDGTGYRLAPLTGFELKWPTPTVPEPITLQVGANQGETITFSIAEVSTFSLDLLGINVVTKAAEAIDRFGNAISAVSGARSPLGAISNRLEHTVSNNQVMAENSEASYSRITDADTALEMSNLTRQQILLNSSGAMMAQANASRQHVMWLLKGLGFPQAGGQVAFA